MKARVNSFLNVRTGTPEILPDNNPDDAFFKPGDTIEIVDTVVGQEYKGNDVWHKLDTGIFVSNFGVDLDKNLFFKENTALSINNNLVKKIVLNNFVESNGRGITIGVLDSGIDVGHPSLKAAVKNIEEEDKFFTIPSPINSHGTKVAGLLAGNDNLISGLTIDAFIKTYRVIKKNENVLNDALKSALRELSNSDIDIVNLSLEIDIDSVATIQLLIDELFAKGIIVIVSGGSASGINQISALKNVFCVGTFEAAEFPGLKRDGIRPQFHVSFLNAPILSTGLIASNNGHEIFIDDSAYAALTTGIVARFLSKNYFPRNLRFDSVKKYLSEASFDINQENFPIQLKPYRNESN